MAQYGMPYMGSKNEIVPSLAMKFPPADNFYDLFGGGGSVTHYMLKNKLHRYKQFHYNEIDSSVAQLFKDAIAGKYNYNVFTPEWITRERFDAEKATNGYIKCLWSFGNGQKSYLFGEDVESYKKSLHFAVVFGVFDELVKKTLDIDSWPATVNTITKRRIFIRQKITYNCGKEKRGDLEQLEQLERLQQLEQLERLQQLERLEQLQQLERLVITSKSYDQLQIKPNSVVYCDPPYIGTAQYQTSFNHKPFCDWAANQSCPVFISEYQLNDARFECVYKIDKRVLLHQKTGIS